MRNDQHSLARFKGGIQAAQAAADEFIEGFCADRRHSGLPLFEPRTFACPFAFPPAGLLEVIYYQGWDL